MRAVAVPGAQQAAASDEPRPVFKAGVARVSLAATVRDRRGRPVTNLTHRDFDLFDNGQPAGHPGVQPGQAPVGLAPAGRRQRQHGCGRKRAAANEIARQLLAWLSPGEDHVGLFAFDATSKKCSRCGPRRRTSSRAWRPGVVREDERVRRDRGDRRSAWPSPRGPRRAVMVLTDGDDNASKLTAEEVSASRAASTCRST